MYETLNPALVQEIETEVAFSFVTFSTGTTTFVQFTGQHKIKCTADIPSVVDVKALNGPVPTVFTAATLK